MFSILVIILFNISDPVGIDVQYEKLWVLSDPFGIGLKIATEDCIERLSHWTSTRSNLPIVAALLF